MFLNGHYDVPIAYACANAADKLPRGVMAFPINYWDGMSFEEAPTPEMGERFLSLGVKSTLAVLENIEKPSRPCRRADHRRGVPDTVCVVEA